MPVGPVSEYPIVYRVSDRIARVILDRPERLNATTPELYTGIRSGLERAARDDASVVILEGNGRAFCAGGDLKDPRTQNQTEAEEREFLWTIQDSAKALQTHAVPTIAKVHGYAVGGGLEIALSTDIIVAETETAFRLPEVTLGTYVTGGLLYTLPRRVGIGTARELVFTGRWMDGEEAEQAGLVDRLVPAASLEAAVVELAETIRDNASLSIQYAKQHFNSMDADRDTWLEREVDATLACRAQSDWDASVTEFTGEPE